MTDEINNPHDHVVKNILGREDVAKDFVRYYLPEEITADFDLETLEVSTQSFVSDHLKESLSDLVISIQLQNGDPAQIYILIEHKSGLNEWTKLQLLRYMHEVPEINKRNIKSTITLEVFHLVLEYIFYPKKRDKIYESFDLLFKGLNSRDAGEIFAVLIKYLLSATDETPRAAEEKVKHLPKGEETVKTTAEVLREEGMRQGLILGRQEGRQEGRQDMLIKSLTLKYDFIRPHIIEKIRSIQSIEILDNLFALTYKCSSIDEFTEYMNQATGN